MEHHAMISKEDLIILRNSEAMDPNTIGPGKQITV